MEEERRELTVPLHGDAVYSIEKSGSNYFII
jgi:hypothetical protein